MPTSKNLEAYQGDTYTKDFQVTSGGNGFDISAWTVKGEIRTGPGGTLAETFTINVTAAATGEFTASLSASETAALDVDVAYWYDIQISHADGTVYTIWKGRFTVEAQITEGV